MQSTTFRYATSIVFLTTIASGLCLPSPSLAARGPRTILFSGIEWDVKNSGKNVVGPGPNYFSSSRKSVRVDSSGRLHLRIRKRNGRWYSSEVIAKQSFGHGTYRFYLDSAVNDLDPSAVLGLFTWSDDPTDNHREIDIEFSRWGDETAPDAQYVVQPYYVAGNIELFNQTEGLAQSTHSFRWDPGAIFFQSLRGHTSAPSDSSEIIHEWAYNGVVPPPGDENPRMNLWLFRGRAPEYGRSIKVVVSAFEFHAD